MLASLRQSSPADTAELAAVHALLRCLIREVAAPREEVWPAEPYLFLRVADHLLRVRSHGGIALRFDGAAQELCGGTWRRLTVDRLAELTETEMTRRTGTANGEFARQVAESRDAVAALLHARERAVPPEDPWLASEQSLVLGHPCHPSPKAPGGPGWLRYAPESFARFPLRFVAVRRELAASAGDASALDRLGPAAPEGYLPLPVHPWQLELLHDELAEPLADGRLIDLGYGHGPVHPTSSVRTVYDPGGRVCLKFSLDVRITNCVRKNSWYELAGAVELSRRLGPVLESVARDHPGTRWLAEPGYRSADLGLRLLEGLGVIVRQDPWQVVGPGVTPLLAGSVAAPGDRSAAALAAACGDPLAWWAAYLDRVAPPVFDAYLVHGVVLEPHLQNVLIGIDPEGFPVEAVFRDMEGTKLVAGRHDLTGLPDGVAGPLTYDADRGWSRVVYCLIVNHLAEIAATLAGPQAADGADLHRRLWAIARDRLARYADRHDRHDRLTALLTGEPLPAKANLVVRWARSADRAAGYVPVANPFHLGDHDATALRSAR
ncbi:IucA/IucC family protein [Rhizohabitans arisaemae]|uniref:IucA/IucC family protein n=1 Tax=Rhizohabitans arisaemae TaxID=2720610 RepID=UPI0024B115EE|nr:IucA/IucC family protein [Rhizohabitans arisaemae]